METNISDRIYIGQALKGDFQVTATRSTVNVTDETRIHLTLDAGYPDVRIAMSVSLARAIGQALLNAAAESEQANPAKQIYVVSEITDVDGSTPVCAFTNLEDAKKWRDAGRNLMIDEISLDTLEPEPRKPVR